MTIQHTSSSGPSGERIIWYEPSSATTMTVSGTTEAGVEYTFNDTSEPIKDRTGKSGIRRIGPKLYFRYVKSKFTKIEKKKLDTRLQKLAVLVEEALQYEQYAMYEELSIQLLEAIRESELSVCGINTYLNREDIEKFKSFVAEDDDLDKIIYFKKLEEFPRPLPNEVKNKIKQIKSKSLFEELWVLYLDYTEDSKKIKSNKEKIREKDPILFGTFKKSNKFYFIIDWVDEVCDLILDKIVDTIDVDAKLIPKIDEKYVQNMKKRIEEQAQRLEKTNMRNYKDLMKKEDEERKTKKSWWKFWSK